MRSRPILIRRACRIAEIILSLAVACLPLAAFASDGPRSIIYILNSKPTSPEAQSLLSEWYGNLSYDIVDRIKQAEALRSAHSGVWIQPKQILYKEAATEDSLGSTQRANNAFLIITTRLEDTPSVVHLLVYFGDLKGSFLDKNEIKVDGTLSAKGVAAFDQAILFISLYSIAMDANRLNDKKGACAVLRRAELTGRGATFDRADLSLVKSAIGKSIAALNCAP